MSALPPRACARCGQLATPIDVFCATCGAPVAPAVLGDSAHPARTTDSPMRSAPDPATGVLLAGLGKRALAYLVDFVVVMVPLICLCVGTGVALSRTVHHPNGTQTTGDSGFGTVIIIAEVLVVSIGYFAICNGRYGSTIGMRAFHIGVRDEDGQRLIGPMRAALRFGILYAFLCVPIGGIFVVVVDLMSPLWDRRRQAWHDKIANSLVVQLPIVGDGTG